MAHTSFYLKIIVSTQEKRAKCHSQISIWVMLMIITWKAAIVLSPEKAFPRMKTSQTLKNVLKFMKLSMSMTTTECTNLSVF